MKNKLQKNAPRYLKSRTESLHDMSKIMSFAVRTMERLRHMPWELRNCVTAIWISGHFQNLLRTVQIDLK